MLSVYFEQIELVAACSKLRNCGRRCACTNESCIDLTVLQCVSGVREGLTVLNDIGIDVQTVSSQDLTCVEFYTGTCVTGGYALAF